MGTMLLYSMGLFVCLDGGQNMVPLVQFSINSFDVFVNIICTNTVFVLIIVLFSQLCLGMQSMIYGRKTGVFSSRETCHNQVVGFKGDCYKKYNTREEAEAAFHG